MTMEKNNRFNIKVDYSRNNLLKEFGSNLIKKSYLKEGEDYQEFFAMVASQYMDIKEEAQYIYDMISQLYFLPATPTLANARYAHDTTNNINLPISCFLNEVENNKESIQHVINETIAVSNGDGGIGTYWSNIGGATENLDNQQSWGVIPYIKIAGDCSRYFGGNCRKTGSSCAYLKVDHPQIEEFINSRKPQVGGDQSTVLQRHVHIGIVITEDFIEKVNKGENWNLVEPTGEKKIVKTVSARNLWRQMLITRVETGEPFMIFIDNINKVKPEVYKKLGINIHMSNLCTEIVLPTGLDHLGNNRTSICCLGSINLCHFDRIKEKKDFFYYISKFIDNVRLDFIKRGPESLKDAVYASKRDGSIGLGVSGLSTYFQEKGWSHCDENSKKANKEIFKTIKKEMDIASYKLAIERGACDDGKETGIIERFVNKIALKPDALTSYIFNVSPNVEPMPPACIYDTMYGSYMIKNPVLLKKLEEHSKNNNEIWEKIISEGSVKNLNFLSLEDKLNFKSPYEVDQLELVAMAADRTPYICQAQSLNLFFETPIDAEKLHKVHMYAAQNGVKSLYYLRTKSQFSIENNYRFKNSQEEKTRIGGDVCVGCD